MAFKEYLIKKPVMGRFGDARRQTAIPLPTPGKNIKWNSPDMTTLFEKTPADTLLGASAASNILSNQPSSEPKSWTQEKVFGKMNAGDFSSILGRLGYALSPNSPMGRVGATAADLAEREQKRFEEAPDKTLLRELRTAQINRINNPKPTYDQGYKQLNGKWYKGYNEKGTNKFIPTRLLTDAEADTLTGKNAKITRERQTKLFNEKQDAYNQGLIDKKVADARAAKQFGWLKQFHAQKQAKIANAFAAKQYVYNLQSQGKTLPEIQQALSADNNLDPNVKVLALEMIIPKRLSTLDQSKINLNKANVNKINTEANQLKNGFGISTKDKRTIMKNAIDYADKHIKDDIFTGGLASGDTKAIAQKTQEYRIEYRNIQLGFKLGKDPRTGQKIWVHVNPKTGKVDALTDLLGNNLPVGKAAQKSAGNDTNYVEKQPWQKEQADVQHSVGQQSNHGMSKAAMAQRAVNGLMPTGAGYKNTLGQTIENKLYPSGLPWESSHWFKK